MNSHKVTALVLVILLGCGLVNLGASGKAEKPAQESPAADASPVQAQTPGQEQPREYGSESPAALVNGAPVTHAAVDRQLAMIQLNYLYQGYNLEEEHLEVLRIQVLDSLIDQELLYQYAVKKGYTADAEVVESEMQEIRGQFDTEEAYVEYLKSQYFTPESLRQDIGQFYAVQKMAEEEFYAKQTVSDAQARKFYDENPEMFMETPEQIAASHILITVENPADKAETDAARTKIQALLNRVKAGEDFAKVARENSQCPSAQQGGDLGYFGRGAMVAEFEDAAFALNPGEISGIVQSQFGFHIIKVTDKTDVQMMGYEAIKEQIKAYMINENVQQELADYLVTLRAAADVQLLN